MPIYNCECCKYTTTIKGNYVRHLSTKNHLKHNNFLVEKEKTDEEDNKDINLKKSKNINEIVEYLMNKIFNNEFMNNKNYEYYLKNKDRITGEIKNEVILILKNTF